MGLGQLLALSVGCGDNEALRALYAHDASYTYVYDLRTDHRRPAIAALRHEQEPEIMMMAPTHVDAQSFAMSPDDTYLVVGTDEKAMVWDIRFPIDCYAHLKHGTLQTAMITKVPN